MPTIPYDWQRARRLRQLIEQSSLGQPASDKEEDVATFVATIAQHWNHEDQAEFARHFSLTDNGARQSIELDALRHAARKGISAREITRHLGTLQGTKEEKHDALTQYLDDFTRERRSRG